MSDLLNPANLIVLAVIAIGMFFGLRRIAASTRGKSCCSDGASGRKAKKVVVSDTDVSHYSYSDELLIGGMSCDGCAQNVANALNALDGIWATVTYVDHTARVRSKQPIDRGVLETAVKDAGYYVMKLWRCPSMKSCPCSWKPWKHSNICAKNNLQMRQKWSLVTVCAEFATNRASTDPSKKLQVYSYILIIAVLRLQLTWTEMKNAKTGL